jgi:hypothetical protein
MADDDADGVSEERSPSDSLLVQWVFEPTDTERAEVSDALHRAFGQGLVVGELHRFGTQRYRLIRVSSEASAERITLAPIVRRPEGNENRVGSAFIAAESGIPFADSEIRDFDGDGNPDLAYCVWTATIGEERVVGFGAAEWYQVENPTAAPPDCGAYGD